MTDAAVYTMTGLTETDVICRYSNSEKSVLRFWHEPGFDFAAGHALPWTEFYRSELGFAPGDDERIQLAVKQVSGNFPDGGLESRVGWSWLLERAEGGWVAVAERRPGAVGRMLASERAVSFRDLGRRP